MEEKEVKVKSLYKALKIFECFSAATPELGITQISEMLELNKSNVYNIISTFEQLGYIEKNQNNSKYRLGLKILEFSYIINENLGYQRAIYDIMQKVANETNAIVYFGVPKNFSVLYLYSVYPKTEEYDFPIRSIMGERAPFYCTSLGKAMLAYMEKDDAVEEYIKRRKVKFTDNTILEPEAFRKELEDVKEQGYAIDNIEHEFGVKCIGVPIFNRVGNLVGGLSVSGSVGKYTQDYTKHCIKTLTEARFLIRDRL